MSESGANTEEFAPSDLAEEMGEGAEAIAEDTGKADGASSNLLDGLMSAEPDTSPADAQGLLESSHGPKAHFEVGLRKFLHGYDIEGIPAAVHFAVAAFSMAQTQMDSTEEETESDGTDGFEDIDVEGEEPV